MREDRLFTDFEKGVMVGLLIGEGHFGGDGRQPQVTLRMHVRHEALFRWIEKTFPGGKLYGPYNHDGRQYLQWMARGSYLRDVLVPVLDDYLTAELDTRACQRYEEMKARYHHRLGLPPPIASGDQPTDAKTSHEADHQAPPYVPPAIPDGLKAAEVFERLRRERPT
jgi:hypothetical protein